jgi:hypothetical protein
MSEAPCKEKSCEADLFFAFHREGHSGSATLGSSVPQGSKSLGAPDVPPTGSEVVSHMESCIIM